MDCDEWYEPETDWHRFWKSLVPKEWCEQVIKKNGEIHRADILTPDGLVIELQHSSISPDEIEDREEFYENMVWLFDCRGKTFEKWRGSWSKMKYPKKHIAYCNKPVFLQYSENIQEVKHYNDKGVYELVEEYTPLSWFRKITGLSITPAIAYKYYMGMGASGYPNITVHDRGGRAGAWGVYVSERIWNGECEVWDDIIMLKKSCTLKELEWELQELYAVKPRFQFPPFPPLPEKPEYAPPDCDISQVFEEVAKGDVLSYKYWWIEIFRAFENQTPNSHVEQGGEIRGSQAVLYVKYKGYIPCVKEEKYTLNSARDIIKAITKHNLNGVYSRLINELSNTEEYSNIIERLRKEYDDRYAVKIAEWSADCEPILKKYIQLLDENALDFRASYKKWHAKRVEIYSEINMSLQDLLDKFKRDVFKKYKHDIYLNKKWIIGNSGIDKRRGFVYVSLHRKKR
jgi:hypothetical protein